MTRLNQRFGFGLLVLAWVAAMLAGCSSTSLNRAPVEDRPARAPASTPAPAISVTPLPAAAPVAVKQPQGFENAGKPGYYTVKPGDTLLRIALENGQTTQDIARWSQVENPNRIEVGQVLRVVPPLGSNEVVVRPVAKPGAVAAASSPAAASSGAASSSAPASQPAAADSDITWVWPASGAVLAGFDEVKNKGLDISGNAGDPVLAAADGRVVYVGAGLRGYGNLIILKHNNVFLTAYAHNQTLLVKEDQSVLKGQKIAQMGNSDADRVKLHFEVRRQGKPVDPARYLPAR
ncbi:peptidoglycan DD-metalloendopeptidase family protein [Rhodoferax sp.]|uniref:peptidoglycan DD-metalloendopeptidase family protein n=1 Tax=Rhodoferax sp. TaxID=50421 RepID=UPI0026083DF0|nr:peptidoglycan DD-metalloendopeptidase family protein [Rhodoferax sp.]MDD2924716.1 peptidoglycan DD-metalloendopeptidase family protein [Rhodoferax sp.]